MISWHKVGQHVVCVNKHRYDNHFDVALGPLTLGMTYTIAAVDLCGDAHGKTVVGFELEELPNADWCVDPRHFEPVYPHALERLRDLCSPTPEEKRPFFEEMIHERVDAWQRERAG